MGITGLGSSLSLMGIRYGSGEAIKFTEDVERTMAVIGYQEGYNLAVEKGMAPIFYNDSNLESWVNSKYMKKIWEQWPEGKELVSEKGCRFTHHTSIAPTGTISLSFGNNVSNGIEPSFSHAYTRNVILEGKKSKSAEKVYSYEGLVWKQKFGEDSIFPPYFVTTEEVTPKEHIDMQAAAQKWCDSSISKTINVPTDIDYEEFQHIYLEAYKNGLKGCTTFRFNPEAFQGVLVKEKDLKNTLYEFVLEDGEIIEASGDQEIQYDGETHTAANLFDAIKENYYGKF